LADLRRREKSEGPKTGAGVIYASPKPLCVLYLCIHQQRKRERAVERCKEGNKDRKIERAPAGQS